MSSNVGLSTPRGSGTSGYVQKNLSHTKARQKPYPSLDELSERKHRLREPDAEILQHDRNHRIEVEVVKLRDKLEDEGVDEDTIDDRCDDLRQNLKEEAEKEEHQARGPREQPPRSKDAKKLKTWQTHELAEAKKDEQEKLRKALGIRKDYEEGGHWKKQEERLRESLSDEKTKNER